MTTPLPLSPFITEPENRFVLDEAAFMAAIEPPPSFIDNPSRDYMKATELRPIVEVLAGYTA